MISVAFLNLVEKQNIVVGTNLYCGLVSCSFTARSVILKTIYVMLATNIQQLFCHNVMYFSVNITFQYRRCDNIALKDGFFLLHVNHLVCYNHCFRNQMCTV